MAHKLILMLWYKNSLLLCSKPIDFLQKSGKGVHENHHPLTLALPLAKVPLSFFSESFTKHSHFLLKLKINSAKYLRYTIRFTSATNLTSLFRRVRAGSKNQGYKAKSVGNFT